jgi:hypothetical protein
MGFINLALVIRIILGCDRDRESVTPCCPAVIDFQQLAGPHACSELGRYCRSRCTNVCAFSQAYLHTTLHRLSCKETFADSA